MSLEQVLNHYKVDENGSITIKAKENGENLESQLRVGTNVDEAIRIFGEDIVFQEFIKGIKVTAQNQGLRQTGTLDGWSPSLVGKKGKRPVTVGSLANSAKKLTKEQRLALIAELENEMD